MTQPAASVYFYLHASRGWDQVNLHSKQKEEAGRGILHIPMENSKLGAAFAKEGLKAVAVAGEQSWQARVPCEPTASHPWA